MCPVSEEFTRAAFVTCTFAHLSISFCGTNLLHDMPCSPWPVMHLDHSGVTLNGAVSRGIGTGQQYIFTKVVPRYH